MDRDQSRRFVRRSMLFTLGLMVSLAASGSSTTLNVSDASATAGDAPGTIDFAVQRSGDLSYPVDVQYHTQDGSALDGSDYSGGSGSLAMDAGQSSGTVSLPIAAAASSAVALDKTFQLIIDGVVGRGSPLQFSALTSASVDFPRTLGVADLNGDGRPEVIVTRGNGDTLDILRDTTAPGAAVASFAPAQSVALGQAGNVQLYAVAAADLNGDGRRDLVVSAQTGGNVTVLLNTTAPGASTITFAAPQIVATGFNTRSVDVVDFNGDGRPDIEVMITGTSSVGVLLNTTAAGASTASFAALQSFAVPGFPASSAIADFNGDGRPDLVAATVTGLTLLPSTTAPGASVATVGSAQLLALSGGYIAHIGVGDVNGDGRPDLLAASDSGNGVAVLLNTTAPGASSFSFAAPALFASGVSAGSVALGDLDGDGRADIVIPAAEGDAVAVLRNTTSPGATVPRFAAATMLPLGAGMYPRFAALADLDADGRLDIVASGDGNAVSALLNRTPAPPPALAFTPLQSFAGGEWMGQIVRGDFNGDGREDLAIAEYGPISIWLNTTAPGATTASFADVQRFYPESNPSRMMAGDFNGDGITDLAIVHNFSNTVSVQFNTTAPGSSSVTFTPVSVPITGLSSACCSSFVQKGVAADFNGDGRLDIAVSTSGKFLAVLYNEVAPGAATADFVETHVDIDLHHALHAMDVNGDGRPDLAGPTYQGGLGVFFNATPLGSTGTAFTYGGDIPWDLYPDEIAIGDVNGDGLDDVVAGSGDAGVLINQTARGASSAAFAFAPPLPVLSYPRTPVLADFDGDGRLDIAFTHEGGGVLLLRNTTPPGSGASTSFSVLMTLAAGTSVLGAAAPDLNGDGKPDIAFADYENNNLLVALNAQLLVSAAVAGGSGNVATGTIHVPAVDTTPDAFSFSAVADATPGASYTSNTVTIGGLGAPAPISISGGSYSVGCTASFTTAAATISDGETVCVRVTASNQFSTAVSATLSIGGVAANFVVTTVAADTTPDAFSFAPVSGVERGALVASAPIIVSGVNTDTPISISGGEYSVNGGAFVASAGVVHEGDSVAVRLTSAASFSTPLSARVSIGGVDGVFTVTTRPPTTAPIGFGFTPVNDAPLDTVITSDAIVVTGIEAAAPITISGDHDAAFCINANPCVNMVGATVQDGDSVRVQVRSSDQFSTMTVVTLDIGGTQGSFNVITLDADIEPDVFAFTPLSGVEPSTTQTSNALTVSGINTAAPVSVVGGEYSINGSSYTAAAGTVQAGDSISVRLIAAATYDTERKATLSIGDVSADFTVTTRAADVQPDPFSFTPVTDVARNALISSNDITVSGIDVPVAISISGGEYSIDGGAWTAVPGTVAGGASVSVRVSASPAFSTPVRATLMVGSGSDARSANFIVTTLAAVTTPDPFGFGTRSDVALDSLQVSNDVTITGINTDAPISVVGGEYSLDGGASWQDAAGSVAPGAKARVRVRASGQFSTATTVTLTVGGVQGSFVVTTLGADTQPDAFAFASLSDAPLSSEQISNSVTISGTNTDAPIQVSGGAYSIDGGAFTSAAGTIAPGASVRLRVTASAMFSTPVNATLTIGGVPASFTVTTLAAITDPNAFSFGTVSDVPLGSLQTSGAVTVTGINTTSAIHVSGGEYRIGAGAFTSADGSVNPGDTISVRGWASEGFSTATKVTVTIGTVEGSYTITTLAMDSTPDPFAFNSVSGVNPSTEQTSDPVTITGINTPTAVHVEGGSYSIDDGDFVSADGSIGAGQTLRVRGSASAEFDATRQIVVSVGGVSAAFSITTVAADTTPDDFAFAPRVDVVAGSTQTSEAIVVSGINTAAPISVSGGRYNINGGPYESADGSVLPGDQVTLQLVAGPGSAQTTAATLTIGGVSASFSVTTVTIVDVTGKGGGGAANLALLAVLALAALWRRRRALALLLPLLLSSLPAQALQLSKLYVGARLGEATTDASSAHVTQELQNQGYALSAHTDNKRAAGELFVGYRVHPKLSLELGYLRGREQSVRASGPTPPADEIRPMLHTLTDSLQGFGNALRAGFVLEGYAKPRLKLDPRLSLVYWWTGRASASVGDVEVSQRDAGLGAALGTTLSYRLWGGLWLGVGADYYYLPTAHDFTWWGGQLRWDFGH